MESNILTLALHYAKSRCFHIRIFHDGMYVTAKQVSNTLRVFNHIGFVTKYISDPDFKFRISIRNVEIIPAWERTDELVVIPFVELVFDTEEEAILYRLTNPHCMQFGSNEFSENTLSLSNDDNSVKRINIYG